MTPIDNAERSEEKTESTRMTMRIRHTLQQEGELPCLDCCEAEDGAEEVVESKVCLGKDRVAASKDL